ncbi:MAG: hypothetical protein PVI40_03190 [Chlamydiota bacterium]|jgi:hypothetical protein
MTDKSLLKSLKKLSQVEKREGELKGLSKKELSKRINFNYNDIYRSLVWFVRGVVCIALIWIIYMVIVLSIHLWSDYSKLEKVLSNVVQYIFIILATLGGQGILKKLMR